MQNVVVKEIPMLRVCPQCRINLSGECVQCPQCGMNVSYVKSYPLSQAGFEQMTRENAQILQQGRAGGAQIGGGYAQQIPQGGGGYGQAQPDGSAAVPNAGGAPSGGAAPQEGAAGQARFCPQCGTKLVPGAKFCSGCGAKLA